MEQTQISGVCCAPWAGAGCNGIASPECCHGGTGQWEGEETLDTAFPRAGALLGGPVPSRSVLILGYQALFSASAKLWIFFFL